MLEDIVYKSNCNLTEFICNAYREGQIEGYKCIKNIVEQSKQELSNKDIIDMLEIMINEEFN